MQFSKKNCNFFKFFFVFIYFQHPGPTALLQCLIINSFMVSRVNGVDINFLMTPVLAFFDKFFFQIFGKSSCSKFMDIYEPVELFKPWKRILDSLLRQWNGFEDFIVLNFSKILLKFAIVFNFFSFSEFNDHYWPTKLLGLSDGLLDRTPDSKGVLNIFSLWNLETFLLSFALTVLLTRLEN